MPGSPLRFVGDLLITLEPPENRTINTSINRFVGRMEDSARYYSEHRASNVRKARRDIFLGKKVEFFALIALTEHFDFPPVTVDMRIRKGREKGWEEDLAFSRIGAGFPDVHVKGCDDRTIAWCGEPSWTFQFSDDTGKGKDRIFGAGHEEDLVALVYVMDEYYHTGHLRALVPWGEAKKLLREPVKDDLLGIKKCIYLSDMEKYFPESGLGLFSPTRRGGLPLDGSRPGDPLPQGRVNPSG